mmetsp:Transcript_21709/g.53635  ORF Transcript_21709/g.53635 Transcript_21709/m.53635 type:complete len:104 (+) Transcript_21709:481-792(+)
MSVASYNAPNSSKDNPHSSKASCLAKFQNVLLLKIYFDPIHRRRPTRNRRNQEVVGPRYCGYLIRLFVIFRMTKHQPSRRPHEIVKPMRKKRQKRFGGFWKDW